MIIDNPRIRKFEEILNKRQREEQLVITKKDLYELYIEEGILQSTIAELYNVKESKILYLRRKWNIRFKQLTLTSTEFIEEIIHKINNIYELDNILASLRYPIGIPSICDLYNPILTILKDKKLHDIREFWDITEENYEIVGNEIEICGEKGQPTLFYRANWCLHILLKAKLIVEVGIREYKITQRGIEFINEIKKKKIKDIKTEDIYLKYNDFISDIQTNKISFTEIHDKYISKLKNIKECIKETRVQEEKKHELTKEEAEEEILDTLTISSKLKLISDRDLNKKTKKIDNNKTKRKPVIQKIDFLELYKNNKSVGDLCEEVVIHYEKKRLIELGCPEFAEKIEWTSKERGDGAGYDIESYDYIDGKYEKIYIEVKGSVKSWNTPFEITANEILASKEHKDRYYIYRIGKVKSKEPQIHIIKGDLEVVLDLVPSSYLANIKV